MLFYLLLCSVDELLSSLLVYVEELLDQSRDTPHINLKESSNLIVRCVLLELESLNFIEMAGKSSRILAQSSRGRQLNVNRDHLVGLCLFALLLLPGPMGHGELLHQVKAGHDQVKTALQSGYVGFDAGFDVQDLQLHVWSHNPLVDPDVCLLLLDV